MTAPFLHSHSENLPALVSAFKRWLPRRPLGYPDPHPSFYLAIKEALAELNNTPAGLIERNKVAYLPTTTQKLIWMQKLNLAKWLDTNGPTIFVDPALVEACLLTDVIKTLTPADIKTVWPSVLYVLPKNLGFISPTTGATINYLFCSIFDDASGFTIGKNDYIQLEIDNGDPNFKGWKGREMLSTAFWQEAPECSSANTPLFRDCTLYDTILEIQQSYIPDADRQSRMTERDIRREEIEADSLSIWSHSLIFNFNLLAQSYPEYFHKAPERDCERSYIGSKHVARPITYHLSRPASLRQVVVDSGETHDTTATGRHVRSHWRRGHWRRQPHTEQWTILNPLIASRTFPDGRLYHMVWLEPQLILGDLNGERVSVSR